MTILKNDYYINEEVLHEDKGLCTIDSIKQDWNVLTDIGKQRSYLVYVLKTQGDDYYMTFESDECEFKRI